MPDRRCCCLSADCIVFQDDLDDDAGAGPNSDWTKHAGTWTYTGAVLQESGTLDALILTVAETATKEQYVSCSLSSVVSGDKPRLICNALDEDNYFFVQVEQGAGSSIVGIYRCTGGTYGSPLVEETVADLVDLGDLNMNICCSSDSLTFRSSSTVGGAATVIVFLCDPDLFTAGKKAGLGNGGGGDLDFTAFSLYNFRGTAGAAEPADHHCCAHQCMCEENGVETCVPPDLILTLTAFGDCISDLDGVIVDLKYDAQQGAWVSDDPTTEPGCLVDAQWVLRCDSSEHDVCRPGAELTDWQLVVLKYSGSGCGDDPCVGWGPFNTSAVYCDPIQIVFELYTYAWPGSPTPPLLCDCCDPIGAGGWFGTVTI